MIKYALFARMISKIIPGAKRLEIEKAIRSGLYKYLNRPIQQITEKGLSVYPITAGLPKRIRKIMAESPGGTLLGGIAGSISPVPGSGATGAIAGGIGTTAIKRSIRSKLAIPYMGSKVNMPSLRAISRARRIASRRRNIALIKEYAGRRDIIGAPGRVV